MGAFPNRPPPGEREAVPDNKAIPRYTHTTHTERTPPSGQGKPAAFHGDLWNEHPQRHPHSGHLQALGNQSTCCYIPIA